MSVLADTSVLAEHLRGTLSARVLLRLRLDQGDLIAACPLSRIELSLEMQKSEREAAGALFGALRWLSLDDAVWEQANLLASRYGGRESGVGTVDCCIAACAIVNDIELWTLNVSRYPMFEGLKAPW